jgi:GTP cyclohydrolase I
MLDTLGVLDPAAGEEAFLDVPTTPFRVARMYVDELLSSYQPGKLEALIQGFTKFPAPHGRQEMVVLSPIPFISLCAHHMIPFIGTAHVGYIPRSEVVGLSKIPRVVDFFSHKLQVQERMTSEIADFLEEHLQPVGLIVLLSARHLCMEARGVRKPGVYTRTSALRGMVLDDVGMKDEFYHLIGLPSAGG